MSRIAIIREAIRAAGGSDDFVYYADNSKRDNLRDGDAVYKVPTWADRLTTGQRESVVETLKQHPDVKDAYLSRGFTMKGWRDNDYKIAGGHLKVRFYGLARPWK